jgi:hypothetical protein
MKMSVFWDVLSCKTSGSDGDTYEDDSFPCSLIEVNRRFRGAYYLQRCVMPLSP